MSSQDIDPGWQASTVDAIRNIADEYKGMKLLVSEDASRQTLVFCNVFSGILPFVEVVSGKMRGDILSNHINLRGRGGVVWIATETIYAVRILPGATGQLLTKTANRVWNLLAKPTPSLEGIIETPDASNVKEMLAGVFVDWEWIESISGGD